MIEHSEVAGRHIVTADDVLNLRKVIVAVVAFYLKNNFIINKTLNLKIKKFKKVLSSHYQTFFYRKNLVCF